MNIQSSAQDRRVMLLKQMGAKVTTIQGMVCYVKFDIEGTEIAYVYNINAKDQYFLQRVAPYPLGAGVFMTEEHVFIHIQKDIEQFINASKSKAFQKYVEVNYNTHRAIHDLEDAFMHYNVPIESLHAIEKHLDEISNIVEEVRKNSPKIEPID